MDPAPELPSLPDVPLHAIVSLLPLQQLISTFPRVHPRFSPIRASVLRSNQRLKLHIGDQREITHRKYKCLLSRPFAGHLVDSTGALLYPNTYPSDFYRLRLDTLDRHYVEKLSTLMPAIAHLEVILANVDLSVLSHLTTLLTKWAPTLRTLKLLIGRFKSNGQFVDESLFTLPSFALLVDTLNLTLTSLEHLSLGLGLKEGFRRRLEADPRVAPLHLPLLSRLRQFAFWNGVSEEARIWETVERFAGPALTSIDLSGSGPPWWDMATLARSHLAPRLTRLPISCINSIADCTLFCRFTNVTLAKLNGSAVRGEAFFACLGALSQLGSLQFLSLFCFQVDLPTLVEGYTTLRPFTSLLVLEFSFSTEERDRKQAHDRLVAPYWSHLFPSVQILKVEHSGRFCGVCAPEQTAHDRQPIVDYAQVTPCLSQLFAPLKVMPSLRKIFYERLLDLRAGKIDFIGEFTPEGSLLGTHEYRG